MAVLNTKLLSHPLNWAIIIMMVLIAGSFGHLFLSYLGVEPAIAGGTTKQKNAWTQVPAGMVVTDDPLGQFVSQGAAEYVQ